MCLGLVTWEDKYYVLALVTWGNKYYVLESCDMGE